MSEKPVIYLLKCPHCGGLFEVNVGVVGLPPFDVECPLCGNLVGSEFIEAEYYND